MLNFFSKIVFGALAALFVASSVAGQCDKSVTELGTGKKHPGSIDCNDNNLGAGAQCLGADKTNAIVAGTCTSKKKGAIFKKTIHVCCSLPPTPNIPQIQQPNGVVLPQGFSPGLTGDLNQPIAPVPGSYNPLPQMNYNPQPQFNPVPQYAQYPQYPQQPVF